MKRMIVTLWLSSVSMVAISQMVHGYVFEDATSKKIPVAGAVVAVLNTTNAALTDSTGMFMLMNVNAANVVLITSAVGYKADTSKLTPGTVKIFLKPLELAEVNATAKKVTRLEMTPMNVEVINSGDLVKDACCNLSESFENSPTVDVNFTDAVSGAKEIRLLGLDGVYTQVMVENIPSIRSLGHTFGLNYVPGPWMSSIQVNKGAGSVVNGYESMTGQINIEYKKPLAGDKLFVNLYTNQDLRTELNLISGQRITDHWSTLTAVHATGSWLKLDMNKDRYIDNPLVKGLDFFNRFTYMSGKVFSLWTGVTGNFEDRIGGSMKFDPSVDRWQQDYWGLRLRTNKVDAFAKTAFNLPNENFIGIQYKYLYQNQYGYIGRRDYNGLENSGYLNFIYQKNINDQDDAIKAGASLMVDGVNEHFDTFNRKRLEVVPGIFVEGSFGLGAKRQVVIMGGLRADIHNEYGTFFTPRLNVKWNIVQNLSFRVGGGRGYRVPTLFAENFGLLANSREIIIAPNLGYEEAWNYGAGLNYKFNLNFHEGNINIDYYRTDFIRQVVVDMENVRQLQFYNLNGRSFANALQAEVNYEVLTGFDVKLAYKYELTKTDYTEGRYIIPLRPQHRGLVSLQYTTRNKHWRFNTSANWYGKVRVPDTSPNDYYNQRPAQSKNWVQLNAQITFKWKAWEVYAGGENLLNFMQKNPIIAGDQPFSNQFDASLVWGPTKGEMVFVGFRYSLK